MHNAIVQLSGGEIAGLCERRLIRRLSWFGSVRRENCAPRGDIYAGGKMHASRSDAMNSARGFNAGLESR